MDEMQILYEETVTSKIKYISFIGASNRRFDLAIINTEHFYGKRLVIEILSGKTVILGKEDLEDPGFLGDAFGLSEKEGNDLYEFLSIYY